MSDDRLAEIKAYPWPIWGAQQWLIAEVERLRDENARLSEDWEEVVELRGRLVESTKAYDEVRAALAAAVKANETVVAVRAALQGLYDATKRAHCEPFSTFPPSYDTMKADKALMAARAVAAGVLNREVSK